MCVCLLMKKGHCNEIDWLVYCFIISLRNDTHPDLITDYHLVHTYYICVLLSINHIFLLSPLCCILLRFSMVLLPYNNSNTNCYYNKITFL